MTSEHNNQTSLKHYIKTAIMRSFGIGLVLSLSLTLLMVIYFGIIKSEEELLMTARIATKAFRPMLLETGNAKNVQEQIRDAIALKPNEFVAVRDANLQLIYDDRNENHTASTTAPSCKPIGKVCWDFRHYKISTLTPVYFDKESKELYGYMDISLEPTFEIKFLVFIFAAILLSVLIPTIKLSSKLFGLIDAVGDRLSSWALHVKENPKDTLPFGEIPFQELLPMQEALAGLRSEIEDLENKAKNSAQLMMLRGIAHDILSPVSQLEKFIPALTFYIENGKEIDAEFVQEINGSLQRLRTMAKQVKALRSNFKGSDNEEAPICNLPRELEKLINSYKKDDELKQLNLALRLNLPNQHQETTWAKIPVGDCQRIVDNLMRNAVQASQYGKMLEVTLQDTEHGPAVSVRDQGNGIPEHIQNKIFDPDFTTKAGRGTGLGLTIVRHLCLQNNAALDFKTEAGIGTEFRVIFKPAIQGVTS